MDTTICLSKKRKEELDMIKRAKDLSSYNQVLGCLIDLYKRVEMEGLTGDFSQAQQETLRKILKEFTHGRGY